MRTIPPNYIADSMAICLKIKIKQALNLFIKNKPYPNNQIVNNKTENVPYVWHNIRLVLSKGINNQCLINGLHIDKFVGRLKAEQLIFFAEMFLLVDSKYTNQDLIDCYKKRYNN